MNYKELSDVIVHKSAKKVDVVAYDLKSILIQSGFKIFLTIDQEFEAKAVGMKLTPTIVLVIGIPEVGTKLMNQYPTIAYELPIKVVITQDEMNGSVVLHSDFESMRKKHGIDIEIFSKLPVLISESVQ